MDSGYNTITINGFLSGIAVEDQKKIVTMFNSNKKPLLARLVHNNYGDVTCVDYTIMLYRMDYDDGSEMPERGYGGRAQLLGSSVFIRIWPDNTVTIQY